MNRRRGVNPRRNRLKLDNSMTRAMQDVMKLVRVASNRHLRNWEAPDALAQEITPSGELKDNDAKNLGVRTISPEVFRELLKFVQPKLADA